MLDEEKQTVASRDGSAALHGVRHGGRADQVAEGAGHRRQLLLELVDRALLPASEKAAA